MQQGKFEDTKGVTRGHRSVGQTIQWPKERGQSNTTILNVSGLYEIKIKTNVRLLLIYMPIKTPSTHKNLAASSFFHPNTLVDNEKNKNSIQ